MLPLMASKRPLERLLLIDRRISSALAMMVDAAFFIGGRSLVLTQAYQRERYFRALATGHCEDILQILPYLPSLHGVQIGRLQPDDRGLLLLVEVLQVLQPEIARALDPVVVLGFPAAHLVHRFVDELDHVELVEGDLGVG